MNYDYISKELAVKEGDTLVFDTPPREYMYIGVEYPNGDYDQLEGIIATFPQKQFIEIMISKPELAGHIFSITSDIPINEYIIRSFLDKTAQN